MRVCKVLIVENDDHVRNLLAEVVGVEDYLFTTVETGREIRDALDEDDYDVVIIDVTQPPPEDGFALARVAQEQGCGVILITGNPHYIERLRASGEHYFLKPFRIGQFTALADKVLKEIAAQCIRRKRSDGSLFAARAG